MGIGQNKALGLLVMAVAVNVGMRGGDATAQSFEGLGTLPGGYVSSEGVSVSGDGRFVIGTSNLANATEGFVYDRYTDTMTGLGYLSGAEFAQETGSETHGLSDDGQTVVGWGRSAEGDVEAFLWSGTTGVIQGLGDLPGGGFYSYANNISADGSAAVGGGHGSQGFAPFIYDVATSTMSEISSDDPDVSLNDAVDVSADGKIVVGSYSSSFASGGIYIYQAETDDLSLRYPVSYAAIDSISADGNTIVGSASARAFRYDIETHSNLFIPMLPGDNQSHARGVSGDGKIVVGMSGVTNSFEAFVWDPINGTVSLADVLAGLGLDPAADGWSNLQVEDISADGMTIIGTGTNASGVQEAWVLAIPEPGSAAVVAVLGVMGLLRPTRRGCA